MVTVKQTTDGDVAMDAKDVFGALVKLLRTLDALGAVINEALDECTKRGGGHHVAIALEGGGMLAFAEIFQAAKDVRTELHKLASAASGGDMPVVDLGGMDPAGRA